MPVRKPMESVINEIEFDFEQTVSIRTDAKLSKDDVKQIVSEAPAETSGGDLLPKPGDG